MNDTESFAPFNPLPANKKREEVLDIIKAFALFGIFILHVIGPFSGWAEYLSTDQKKVMPGAELNFWIQRAANALLAEKCRGIFSFLFGIAFFYQLQKVQKGGEWYQLVFLKRLALLFLIGVLHAYLLFAGDVLRYYALCGLVLLVVHQWPNKRILFTGSIFLLVLPLCLIVISGYFPTRGLDGQHWQQVREGFTGTSLAGLIKSNLSLDVHSHVQFLYKLYFLSPILGQFLLGFWAGRSGVFTQVSRYKSVLTRLFVSGFLVRILTFSFSLFGPSWPGVADFPIGMEILHNICYFLGNQSLVLFYICGITLLYQRDEWRPLLLVFSPIGRMSLSIYLLQSVLGALIFYGIGLGNFGLVGPASSVPLTIGLYILMVMFSHVWLSRFAFGPLEWVFRSILNGPRSLVPASPGKKQPLKSLP